MCAKSAHVPNLHTCEHMRIRSALDHALFYWIGSSEVGIASKASHLDARQVRRAGDPA